MPPRIAVAGLATLVALVIASPANAANRYIDDSGNDNGGANNCLAKTSPCKTINHALDAGTSTDTYLVGGGTYTENVLLGGNASLIGSNFNPPATTGAAIVDGGGGIGIAATTSGQISGLTVRGQPAIRATAGSPTITHDLFDGSGGLGRVEIDSSASAQVLASAFTYSGPFADDSAAVYANTTGSVLVANSNVSQLSRGVWTQTASSTTARGNVISIDVPLFGSATGVEVDGGPGTILRNKITAHNSPSFGMYLAGGDMNLHGNVVRGASSAGVYLNNPGHMATMDSDVVTGNGGGGVGDPDSAATLKLRNETVFGNGTGLEVGTPGSVSLDSSIIGPAGITASNGCTITYSRGPTTSGNSCQRFQTSADPQFVSSTNFHLRATSPLIDAGNPLKPPKGATDADGRPRALDGNHDCVPRRDMGAYELPGLCAPPKCTLKAKSSKVSLKKRVIKLVAKCDENVAVTLAGTVKVKRKGKTKLRSLGPVGAKLKKNVARTLKLKLPKSARKALANGAKESARFLLTATNGDAEKGTAKAKIKRLKAKT